MAIVKTKIVETFEIDGEQEAADFIAQKRAEGDVRKSSMNFKEIKRDDRQFWLTTIEEVFEVEA